MDCYQLTKRKARKDHRCCECGGMIKAGETYNSHSGVWDGEPARYKVCPECDELRDEIERLADLNHDEGVCFGDLSSWCEGYHAEKFNEIQKMRGVA